MGRFFKTLIFKFVSHNNIKLIEDVLKPFCGLFNKTDPRIKYKESGFGLGECFWSKVRRHTLIEDREEARKVIEDGLYTTSANIFYDEGEFCVVGNAQTWYVEKAFEEIDL